MVQKASTRNLVKDLESGRRLGQQSLSSQISFAASSAMVSEATQYGGGICEGALDGGARYSDTLMEAGNLWQLLEFIPVTGNKISLWSDVGWGLYQFQRTEIFGGSTSLPTNNAVYDIFAYLDDNGDVAFYTSTWTDKFTRSEAVGAVDWNGDPTIVLSSDYRYKYIGTAFYDNNFSGGSWGFVNGATVYNQFNKRRRYWLYNRGSGTWTLTGTTNYQDFGASSAVIFPAVFGQNGFIGAKLNSWAVISANRWQIKYVNVYNGSEVTTLYTEGNNTTPTINPINLTVFDDQFQDGVHLLKFREKIFSAAATATFGSANVAPSVFYETEQ